MPGEFGTLGFRAGLLRKGPIFNPILEKVRMFWKSPKPPFVKEGFNLASSRAQDFLLFLRLFGRHS